MKELTGPQKADLRNTLLNAFRDKKDIEPLLDEPIDRIVSEGTLTHQVFELIGVLESRGKDLRTFLERAIQARPHNPMLRAWLERHLPDLALPNTHNGGINPTPGHNRLLKPAVVSTAVMALGLGIWAIHKVTSEKGLSPFTDELIRIQPSVPSKREDTHPRMLRIEPNELDSKGGGAFELAETEVTVRQWHAVLGTDPTGYIEAHRKDPDTYPARDLDRPVELVSRLAALAYLNELSRLEGHQACYLLLDCKGRPGQEMAADKFATFECRRAEFLGAGCRGYRLPTIVEWEHAARAGELGKRPAMDPEAQCGGLKESRVVQRGRANQFGLHDMLGNVEEWVADGISSEDLTRPGQLRGGYYGAPPESCTFSYTRTEDGEGGVPGAGLRPARSL